jgi:hypothetical protein
MDSFETKFPLLIRGRFWFANAPHLKWPATLTLDPPLSYRLAMEMAPEQFRGFSHSELPIPVRLAAILGTTEDGEPVSLFDCRSEGSKTVGVPPEFASIEAIFIARCVLFGYHTENLDTVRFQNFSAFFTGFNQWVGLPSSGLMDQSAPPEGADLKRVDELESFGTITIRSYQRSHRSHGDFTETRVVRHWRPEFAPHSPVSYETLIDTMRWFFRLQCLIQGGPVCWKDLSAIVDATRKIGEAVLPVFAKIFPMVPGFESRSRSRHPIEMLFLLEHVEDRWKEIQTVWLSYHQQIEDVLNLYFAVILGEHLFVEHRFLFLAQALEGYHRIRISPARIQLDRRIIEVSESIGGIVVNFIAGVEEFAETVEQARHYLTHPGDPQRRQTNYDFLTLWQQLRMLLEICFLRDLGISGPPLEKVARGEIIRYPDAI